MTSEVAAAADRLSRCNAEDPRIVYAPFDKRGEDNRMALDEGLVIDAYLAAVSIDLKPAIATTIAAHLENWTDGGSRSFKQQCDQLADAILETIQQERE